MEASGRRETSSGGNFGILAFADHLHAHKPIEHTTGKGKPKKLNRAPLNIYLRNCFHFYYRFVSVPNIYYASH